jgi:hypothetical protein
MQWWSSGKKPGQEDVKKLICWSFRDFIFDPKCLPTPHRSLIGHPRGNFCTPSSLQIQKSIFSHLPDELTPIGIGVAKAALELGDGKFTLMLW